MTVDRLLFCALDNGDDKIEESESEKSDDEEHDEMSEAISTMRETQHMLNPPTEEKDLIEKWFAIVFVSK